MATSTRIPKPSAPSLGSYQTALCIIPPAHLHPKIDSLRALYDKAHGKWPPHINLIYPFVAVENLPRAVELIRSKLLDLGTQQQRVNLQLDTSDHFTHRHSNTVFVALSQGSGKCLRTVRSGILDGFKGSEDGLEYHPHLTIGQAPAKAPPMLEYLLDKSRLILPIEWQVEELVVLVRERIPGKSHTESRMEIWGCIDMSQNTLNTREPLRVDDQELDMQENSSIWAKPKGQDLHSHEARKTSLARLRTAYYFSPEIATWKPVNPSPLQMPRPEPIPTKLRLSSYNVLHDPALTLSTDERYPLLLHTILSEPAKSDILILQEVSDGFLSYILNNDTICSNYSFATHAPVNPLPSLRNIVVLSRWNFSWEHISFEQRHKGAAILQLSDVGISNGEGWKPLIVAGVHLSSGLSDNGVAARKSQLQALTRHLSRNYSANPWVMAGDFNIATSNAAIEEAVEMKALSVEAANMNDDLVPIIEATGLVDAWVTVSSENADGVYNGDEGATFDPMENPLAAETARNAGSKNLRPRRYDRIFVKGGDLFEVVDFNMFGLQDVNNQGTSHNDKIANDNEKHQDVTPQYGSDHYGIRAILSIGSIPKTDLEQPQPTEIHHPSIKISAAPLSLANPHTLQRCLTTFSAIPSDVEIQRRKEALAFLNSILQDSAVETKLVSHTSVVLLPVGSYALDTYLSASDIDILALGTFNASSFFTQTVRRLQNAAESGAKILRKVYAATGTMLELEIRGIRCDLQYCCAPGVLSRSVFLTGQYVVL